MNKSSFKKSKVRNIMFLMMVLAIVFSIIFAIGGNVVLAQGVQEPNTGTSIDAETTYMQMKTAFYKAFNTYVQPTLTMISVFMFVCAGVFLGVKWSKAEGAEKQAEIKKSAINWAIGIIVVFVSPLLVQGIAEISIGFASGVWG